MITGAQGINLMKTGSTEIGQVRVTIAIRAGLEEVSRCTSCRLMQEGTDQPENHPCAYLTKSLRFFNRLLIIPQHSSNARHTGK